MTDPCFRFLLIVSVGLLVLAVIDVVRLIRTRHAVGPWAEDLRGARAPGFQATDPGPLAGPSATSSLP